jgi:hypothetical protein
MVKSSPYSRILCLAAATAVCGTLSTARAADYQSAILALGPVAYYRLNETNGAAMAVDISGNGHDGAVQSAAVGGVAGPPFATFPGLGSNNTAYAFDGTANAYINCSNGTNWDIVDPTTGALSIAVWVQTVGAGLNSYQTIACKGDPNWRVENVNASTVAYAINYNTSVAVSGMTDGNWHFIVCTFDGTSLFIYGDGALAGGPAAAGSYTFDNMFDIEIGANTTAGLRNWDGGIDEVAFFNFALSPAQVQQLWLAAKGITGPGILTQPVSQAVRVGGQVSLTVAATGGQLPYRYQWQQDGTDIVGAAATNQTYVIASATPADAGSYTVVVTDANNAFVASQSATLSVLTTVGYRSLVLAMQPAAYYPFNETSGTNAGDIVGGHDASLGTGVTVGAAGPPSATFPGFTSADTALAFDGTTNAFANASAKGYWNHSFYGFTYTAWVLVPTNGWVQGYPGLFDQGNLAPRLLGLGAGSSNMVFGFSNYGAGTQSVAGKRAVADGNWHFVAATFDSIAKTFGLWVDGVLDGFGSGVRGYAYGNSDDGRNYYPIYIGAFPDGANSSWFGSICQVAIFNRALSGAELQELALSGANTFARPIIAAQPASQTVLAGQPVTFSVVPSLGGPPYTYQWQRNGVNITGAAATNQTYTIASVSPADVASYSVVVSAATGTTNSQPASLAMVPSPATNSLEDGLVAHLSFDGTYVDSSGYGNDARPSIPPPQFVAGKIGQALQTAGNVNANVDTCATIGVNAPSLLFGPNDDFSVSFWISYTNNNNPFPIIGNALAGKGHGGWVIEDNSGSVEISLESTDDPLFNPVTIEALTPTAINDGAWHHVVVTMDKTNFLCTTFVDGAGIDVNAGMSVSLTGLGSFIEAGDPTIGADPTATYNNLTSGNTTGVAVYTIDDVAIWRRLLTTNEVASIYSLGQSGKSFGGSIIVGLNILTQPVSQSVLAGAPASFTVAATSGQPPYHYQWQKNGTNILSAAATNQTYMIASTAYADAGTYDVIVTDTNGAFAISQSASLSVLTPVGYKPLLLSLGPAAYYPFNEASGSTHAADIVGGHTAALGSGVTAGAAGPPPATHPGFTSADTAFAYNGSTNAFANCFSAGYWNYSFYGFTFTAWVLGPTNGWASGYPGLFDEGNLAPRLLGLAAGTSNLVFGFNNYGFGTQSVAGNKAVADGNWHFVAAAFDSVAGTLAIYVDGVLDSSASNVIGYAYGNSDDGVSYWPLYIGGFPDGNNSSWLGSISQVAFFNRALSPVEVQELAISGTEPARPIIAVQPAAQTVLAGQPVTFSVVPLFGGPPYSYQWQKNGATIPGAAATNQSYTIASVSAGDVADYSVVVTAPTGKTNSQPASLGVVPAAAPGSLEDRLVAHLSFDGTYSDSSGQDNDARPSIPAPQFVPGKIGQALRTVGNANTAVDSCVTLGINAPSLQFGPTDDFSVSFWVNYTNNNNYFPIIGNSLAGQGHAGWVIEDDNGNVQYSFQSTDNPAFANVTFDAVPPSPINDGAWHHVVMTMDKTNFRVTTFVDGVGIDINGHGTNSLTGLGSFIQAGDPTIGCDPTGTFNYLNGTNATGLAVYTVDDVAIWRRVLSTNEVATIHTLGMSGQSFGNGIIVGLTLTQTSQGLQLNWQAGTLQSASTVTGPWNPVPGAVAPVYTTQPTNSAQYYRIR